MKINLFPSKTLRTCLFAGLVVWLPIVVTVFVLRFIVNLLDQTIALLPTAYQPETLFGIHLPGLGVIFSLLSLIITGIVATNFFGQRIVNFGELILAKIPFVSPIYKASKQIIQAIFATNSQAFRQVVLVEYPRKDIWSLGFLTHSETTSFVENQPLFTVFIPTTPNPTSGFLLLVDKNDIKPSTMSVDEALKFIISLGTVKK